MINFYNKNSKYYYYYYYYYYMNPICTNSKPKPHHEFGKMMVTGQAIDYCKLQNILHDIEVPYKIGSLSRRNPQI